MGEHLDLEVVVEGGQRQLFPLLPGTKCPAGHKCHSRTTGTIGATMQNSLTNVFRDNYKTTLAAQMDWNEFNNEMNTVVSSNHFCSRRHHRSQNGFRFGSTRLRPCLNYDLRR